MNRTFHVLVLLVVGFTACAGDDGVDTSDRDPRCVSACTADEPQYAGVGAVCNATSRALCLDECETRIAAVATVCQNCLVDRACFGPYGCEGGTGLVSCTNNTCTLMSEFGTCTYTDGDEAGRLRCLQQVDPRREVSCTSKFRPTTECASVCN